MKVSDLIKFLTDYVDQDAEIIILSSYYNGSEDVYKDENPVVFANPHLALICADDRYYKQAAQEDWTDGPMAILNSDGSVKETDED